VSVQYWPKNRLRQGDPLADSLTATNSPLARLIKIVGSRWPDSESGNRHYTRGWGKHPADCFSLDDGTFGWFHFAVGNVPDLFHELWKANPSQVLESFGANGELFSSLHETQSENRESPLIYQSWVRDGFIEVAEQPWALRVQVLLWLRDIVAPAIRAWRDLGWRTARGLGILVRWSNSATGGVGPGGMARRVGHDAAAAGAGELEAVEAVIQAYKQHKGEKAEHRRELIRAWFPAGEVIGTDYMDRLLDGSEVDLLLSGVGYDSPAGGWFSDDVLVAGALLLLAFWWWRR